MQNQYDLETIDNEYIGLYLEVGLLHSEIDDPELYDDDALLAEFVDMSNLEI